MKTNIIMFAIISLCFTACDLKTNVVMPEQPKNEKEITILVQKIEMAEREIAILETINESIHKWDSKDPVKIFSKKTIKEYYILLDRVNDSGELVEMEIVKNSERIYDLLSRIQMWNDAIYKFY